MNVKTNLLIITGKTSRITKQWHHLKIKIYWFLHLPYLIDYYVKAETSRTQIVERNENKWQTNRISFTEWVRKIQWQKDHNAPNGLWPTNENVFHTGNEVINKELEKKLSFQRRRVIKNSICHVRNMVHFEYFIARA